MYSNRLRFVFLVSVFMFLVIACDTITPTQPPGSGGGGSGSNTGGPDFIINSPEDDGFLAAPTFFSIQPFDDSAVQRVLFQAGGETLTIGDEPGKTTTRVFLDPNDYPEGELTLSATTVDRAGRERTKQLIVNVVPPSSLEENTRVSRQGAVLGTTEANGAVSVLTVDGSAEGANVSFEARTQEEVLRDTGVDYDALGVTFLGAQEITSSDPLNQTLMVASGGFGPQVQPGQVVVNYRIAPDGDGDGIGELVVVNTASVAPNGDVVSDPITGMQILGETATRLSGRRGTTTARFEDMSVQPGEVLQLTVTGMNPYDLRGNIAIFYSPSRDEYTASRVVVLPRTNVDEPQTALVGVPYMQASNVSLALVNAGSVQSTQAIDIRLEALSPLSASREATSQNFFNAQRSLITDNALFDTQEREMLLNNLAVAESGLSEAISTLEGIDTSESEEVLQDIDRMLQVTTNIPIDFSQIQSLTLLQASCGEGLGSAAVGFITSFIGVATGVAGVITTVTTVSAGAPIFAIGIAAGALSLTYNLIQQDAFFAASDSAGVTFGLFERIAEKAAGISSSVSTPLGGFATGLSLFSLYQSTNSLIDSLSSCSLENTPFPTGGASSSTSSITGMGSAPPPGGSGGGSVISGSSAEALSTQQDGAGQLLTDRYQIKIFSNGRPQPFTGSTDAGGYFFVPFIPEGQPFTAVAIDTETREQRTFEGTGPATGDAVPIFFNFLVAGENTAQLTYIDASKGSAIDTSIRRSFSSMVEELGNNDYLVEVGTRSIINVIDEGIYDIIMIAVPRRSYSQEERDALRRFVAEGGRLILMAERGGEFGFENLNEVAEPFGLRINADIVLDDENNDQGAAFWPVTSAVGGEIQVGIRQLGFFATATISGGEPIVTAEATARVEVAEERSRTTGVAPHAVPKSTRQVLSGAPVIAAQARFGQGLVIAVGDQNIFGEPFTITTDDGRRLRGQSLFAYDNCRFAMNLFGGGICSNDSGN